MWLHGEGARADATLSDPTPEGSGRLGEGALEDVSRVAVDALVDKSAADVVVLAVGPVLALVEQFVVASGVNTRQVRALTDEVEARVTVELGRKPLRIEGAGERQWVLMDYGEVVVHIFAEQVRRYYELERLWADVAAWRPVVQGGSL